MKELRFKIQIGRSDDGFWNIATYKDGRVPEGIEEIEGTLEKAWEAIDNLKKELARDE